MPRLCCNISEAFLFWLALIIPHHPASSRISLCLSRLRQAKVQQALQEYTKAGNRQMVANMQEKYVCGSLCGVGLAPVSHVCVCLSRHVRAVFSCAASVFL